MAKRYPTWFLLYKGTSPDGRGYAEYCGRTMHVGLAQQHYEKNKHNPYSLDRVEIITNNEIVLADNNTNWGDY